MHQTKPPKSSGGGRLRKWLGGLLAFLILLALAAWLLTNAVAEPMLKERLADELDALLGEGMTFDREAMRVDVDLTAGAVEVRNLSLRSDTSTPPSPGAGSDVKMAPDFSSFSVDPIRQLWLNCGRIRLGGFGLSDLAGAASADPADLLRGRSLTLECRSLRWEPPGQPYRLAAAALTYTSSTGIFRADSLRLEPLFAEGDFARRVGYETDRIDLLLPRLELREIDHTTLMAGEGLRARILNIEDMRLEVLRDKRLPGGQPVVKPLPADQLRHLGVPLAVDSLHIDIESITYSEHQNLVDEPGRIRFTDIETRGGPLSTLSPVDLHLSIRALFMGETPLKLQAEFPASAGEGGHRLRGSVGTMELSSFNTQLQRLAFVRVRSGTLHALHFDMELGRQQSSGEVIMDYEGLSIEVLDQADVEAVQGPFLKSLLVNTLVIRNSNHDPPSRKGEVDFERLEQKSVFNYWWKSLLSGILDTIAN